MGAQSCIIDVSTDVIRLVIDMRNLYDIFTWQQIHYTDAISYI